MNREASHKYDRRAPSPAPPRAAARTAIAEAARPRVRQET